MKIMHTVGPQAGLLEEKPPEIARRLMVIGAARVPTAEEVATAKKAATAKSKSRKRK